MPRTRPVSSKPCRCDRRRASGRDAHGVAFWAERPDGSVLFRRRPAKGLLGGLMEVPSTSWRAEPWLLEDAICEAPLAALGPSLGPSFSWQPLEGCVEHAFTHFALNLSIVRARVPVTAGAAAKADSGRWVAPDRVAELALPTLMRKVVRVAQGAGRGPASPATGVPQEVVGDERRERHVEALAAVEEAELDDRCGTDDVGADAAQEVDRRRHGAAGRQQIVEDDDALAGADGVGLDLDGVGAVFERILVGDGRRPAACRACAP